VDRHRQDRVRYSHLTPPLLAIAHGSRDPRAGATVTELLGLAGERAASHGVAGLDIRAAFLGHAPPAPGQVLSVLAREDDPPDPPDPPVAAPRRAAAPAPRPGRKPVIVLPLLLTAGYHSASDIPGLLAGAAAGLPGLRIHCGPPLGPHPGLLRALERRLAEAGDSRGQVPAAGRTAAGQTAAGQTAVVLAAAGSSDPAARAVISALAARWQASRGWLAVRPAYASAAAPTPAEAVAQLLREGARRVVVASYLLAPGAFADHVRSSALAAGAAAVSAPLGAAPEVADVLLSRYRQARLRIGTPGPRRVIVAT
jgi:sirohydrochlorin ferrochelatase